MTSEYLLYSYDERLLAIGGFMPKYSKIDIGFFRKRNTKRWFSLFSRKSTWGVNGFLFQVRPECFDFEFRNLLSSNFPDVKYKIEKTDYNDILPSSDMGRFDISLEFADRSMETNFIMNSSSLISDLEKLFNNLP